MKQYVPPSENDQNERKQRVGSEVERSRERRRQCGKHWSPTENSAGCHVGSYCRCTGGNQHLRLDLLRAIQHFGREQRSAERAPEHRRDSGTHPRREQHPPSSFA